MIYPVDSVIHSLKNWGQIKSTIFLLTLFTKSSEMGRTAETKVNLESAKDFTLLIFPYRVKSLDDQIFNNYSPKAK